ncbi:bifunctional DNA primase/polymerase [Faecalicatena contorta]|uniref:bifunctional DNA primase/polymerase n=1 Tax=Faecalicatena contorta TaxID=39482 RepID=UPI001F2C7130|nr:bifunctional DNA primase/polymerase [Faecalicatena contorta]MCF2684138.1 bifunctional DNA primase/polymerase [Faecalicatena contorta]
MSSRLKDAALLYANMGFAVFPLRPKDKRPAIENGFKAATTSEKQIVAWWDEHPDSNIGIATGAMSGGLVVIDLDIDKDRGINGYEFLKEWQQEHGELPETWQSITGRGGYHLFYRDNAANKSRGSLYEGIDIRADGGYIVAPPSVHPNGICYEWEQGPGDGIDIAQVDNRVAEFLLGPVPENGICKDLKCRSSFQRGSARNGW